MSITYATCSTTPCYASNGALQNMSYDAGMSVANGYNSRLQPLFLSATGPAGAILSLSYDFHSGNGDNGNVFQIVNGKDGNRTQNFTYDQLNRITSAYTNGANWGEAYTIDAWGNLTNRGPVTGKTNYEGLSATALTSNRLSGFGYDAAGNMTSNGSVTFTYDAENRLVTSAGYTYSYDGDGNRVMKSNGSTGTIYWRGAGGEVIDEGNLSDIMQEEYVFFGGKRVVRWDVPTGHRHYYFSDHLGSANVVTDNLGNVQDESDFYPYGGEIPVTNTYVNTYKFTGKERDAETGLDNFGARFYTSNIGRFMTPDWAARPTNVPYAVFGDPQTLNLYTYVENAPINRADADGHCPLCLAVAGGGVLADEAPLVVTGPVGWTVITATAVGLTGYAIYQHFNQSTPSTNQSTSSTSTPSSNEQGRDAQGKFLPKQPGQTQPGADAEKKGLDSAGASKNTQPIPGSNRIPDGKTADGQYVEVKSGGTISNTGQLKETGAAAVAETGKPLIVVPTNPNVKVSGPAKTNPNLDIKKPCTATNGTC